ncbi:Rieske 2Fe-2S domain-containing protein [Polyangium spumosum]|uniref:Rieske 2Fe-2S domain-containing protein n=2 Tax=Polyangium spumosum TaxID=889282 RepID=A0A6N7Q052_9BACT|nr:Rieske 2Fe-2S domain-containing protein [Polyangium spumosum]
MAEPMQNDLGVEPPRADRPDEPSRVDGGRRGALKVLCALGGAAYAGAIVVPAVKMLAPSSEGGAGAARWMRVCRLADLTEGEPRRVVVVGDERDAYTVTRDQLLGSIWLTKKGEGVTALSAVCPHLGCSIDLNADKKSFFCPCHTSRFSLAGAAEAGPSPRDMDPLTVRVVEGNVEVDFKLFRQGIAERKEVG